MIHQSGRFSLCCAAFAGLCLAAAVAAEPTDAIAAAGQSTANWSVRGGGMEIIRRDGRPVVRLSGTTHALQKTFYITADLKLPAAVDLRKKQLRFTVATTTPEAVTALFCRAYPAGDKKPVWSFVQWGRVFTADRRTARVELAEADGGSFKWESGVVSGRPADRIVRLQFWVGSTVPDRPIDLELSDFSVVPAPPPSAGSRWRPVPERADRPAAVRHPVGSLKAADIARARENIKRHAWARETLDSIRQQARRWLQRDQAAIENMIPAEDPWFKCLCPNCGTQPEFAWAGDVLQPDGKSIRCTKCRMVFPNDQFPEDRTYTVKTPDGRDKVIRYYHGKDQIAQKENYGPRYHLTGAVNYVKIRELRTIDKVAMLHVLTGDREAAQKVRDVLVRFAEVYPNYSVKFRATAYQTPRDHFMAGKLCAWKFHDSATLPSVLNAYTLTYNSGVYSDADKLKIENGICREYAWLITAWPPTKDWCLNAVPAHMTTAALCAAILGDHELMNWVLNGKDGFISFIDQYYLRDGHWYENTPSYSNMATNPLIMLVAALQGYSDAPGYTGADRYDRLDILRKIPALPKVFSGMAPGTLPTGNLPAINDSSFNARQSQPQLELLAALQPTPENRRAAAFFARRGQAWGREMSLFFRDPELAPEASEPPADYRKSLVLPGGGWALLRRPESAADSAVLLSFGPYAGGHSHNSTLNYLYCDFGKEVSSDLGYLSWWHENRTWLNSTLAHNLVMVDGKPQSNQRFGELELFAGATRLLAARFRAPTAYPGVTDRYARTLLNVPLAGGRQYLVDLFEVGGGREHLWSFHADGESFVSPITETAACDTAGLGTPDTGAGWLRNGRSARIEPGSYRFDWKLDDRITTSLHYLAAVPQELIFADAPGLRDQNTPYAKPKLNLLLARAAGPDNRFLTVVESHAEGGPRVRSAQLLGTAPLTLEVRTTDGVDRFEFAPDGGIRAVRRTPEGRPTALFIAGAGRVEADGAALDGLAPLNGSVTAWDPRTGTLTSDLTELPAGYDFADHYLQIAGRKDGACRLAGASLVNGRAVFRLHPGERIKLNTGDRFTLQPVVEKILIPAESGHRSTQEGTSK